MAITVVSLGSVADTNLRSAYSIQPARAPNDNSLVIVTVIGNGNTVPGVGPTDVSSTGLTFSMSSDTSWSNGGKSLSVWRGMGTSLDNSLITITFVDQQTSICALAVEVSGVSKAGSNGANAFGGSAFTKNSDLSLVYNNAPSAASTANAWYSLWGRAGETAPVGTPFLNYISIDSTGVATPNCNLQSAYTLLSSGNSMRWINPSNTGFQAGYLIELVADNPPSVSTSTTQWVQSWGVRGTRAFTHRVRGDMAVRPGHSTNTDPYQDTGE